VDRNELKIDALLPSQAMAVAMHCWVRVKPGITPVRGWGGIKREEVGIVTRLMGNRVTVAFARQPVWRAYTDEVEVVQGIEEVR
jgi:hypothetical protein